MTMLAAAPSGEVDTGQEEYEAYLAFEKDSQESIGASAPAAPTIPRRGARFDIGDKTWQGLSNCLGVDPDLFFPTRGASTREAKKVCRGCVVREDCLEYALVNGEKFGIWGGLSERERRRLHRKLALARGPKTKIVKQPKTKKVAAGPNSTTSEPQRGRARRNPPSSQRVALIRLMAEKGELDAKLLAVQLDIPAAKLRTLVANIVRAGHLTKSDGALSITEAGREWVTELDGDDQATQESTGSSARDNDEDEGLLTLLGDDFLSASSKLVCGWTRFTTGQCSCEICWGAWLEAPERNRRLVLDRVGVEELEALVAFGKQATAEDEVAARSEVEAPIKVYVVTDGLSRPTEPEVPVIQAAEVELASAAAEVEATTGRKSAMPDAADSDWARERLELQRATAELRGDLDELRKRRRATKSASTKAPTRAKKSASKKVPTRAEKATLWWLIQRGGVYEAQSAAVAEMAVQAGVSGPTMTIRLNSLRAAGWVECERFDPGKGANRVRVVRVTAEGRAAYRSAKSTKAAQVKQVGGQSVRRARKVPSAVLPTKPLGRSSQAVLDSLTEGPLFDVSGRLLGPLAEQLGLKPAGLSGTLRRMDRAGLICRIIKGRRCYEIRRPDQESLYEAAKASVEAEKRRLRNESKATPKTSRVGAAAQPAIPVAWGENKLRLLHWLSEAGRVEEGDGRVSALVARQSGVNQTAVSTLLGYFQQRGWVGRDARNKRTYWVEITQEGRDELARERQRLLSKIGRLLDRVLRQGVKDQLRSERAARRSKGGHSRTRPKAMTGYEEFCFAVRELIESGPIVGPESMLILEIGGRLGLDEKTATRYLNRMGREGIVVLEDMTVKLLTVRQYDQPSRLMEVRAGLMLRPGDDQDQLQQQLAEVRAELARMTRRAADAIRAKAKTLAELDTARVELAALKSRAADGSQQSRADLRVVRAAKG